MYIVWKLFVGICAGVTLASYGVGVKFSDWQMWALTALILIHGDVSRWFLAKQGKW